MFPISLGLRGPFLSRRYLLVCIGAAGTSALAGCAGGEPPAQVGSARAEWDGRRRQPGPKATLLVVVSSVRVGKGLVRAGLYNAETRFPQEGVELSYTTITADAAEVTLRFDSVPYGKYALAAFQDENANTRLDTTLGIPSEPYGFSSGASVGIGGPPSFERAAFVVNAPAVRQTISL